METMNDDSTKDLYRRRLEQKLNDNKILQTDNTEEAWETIRINIAGAAEEALEKKENALV